MQIPKSHRDFDSVDPKMESVPINLEMCMSQNDLKTSLNQPYVGIILQLSIELKIAFMRGNQLNGRWYLQTMPPTRG